MIFSAEKILEFVGRKGRAGTGEIFTRVNSDPAWIDLRHVAYFMATIEHETAYTMKPIREWNRGRGFKYGRIINGYAYYGRGYIQLTWIENYKRVGEKLGIGSKLADNPDLALDPHIAYEIASEGMRGGWFTGKKLSDYINPLGCDYIAARAIINGNDRARPIAELAMRWELNLRSAEEKLL